MQFLLATLHSRELRLKFNCSIGFGLVCFGKQFNIFVGLSADKNAIHFASIHLESITSHFPTIAVRCPYRCTYTELKVPTTTLYIARGLRFNKRHIYNKNQRRFGTPSTAPELYVSARLWLGPNFSPSEPYLKVTLTASPRRLPRLLTSGVRLVELPMSRGRSRLRNLAIYHNATVWGTCKNLAPQMCCKLDDNQRDITR